MFRVFRTGIGLLALALCVGCAGAEETPLEHVDLGSYTVVDSKLPANDHNSGPWVQRLMGKAFIFGPDRILFPAEFGKSDCQHGGYRLTTRPSSFMQPFDLGAAGTVSLAELELQDAEFLELWNDCLSGIYLSTDRSRMYLPGRGALLILQK